MAINFKYGEIAAANLADNICRLRSCAPGHYEVWFLTFNQRTTQRGFWLRYTIDCPESGSTERLPAVWAGFYDQKNPANNFVIKQELDPRKLITAEHDGPIFCAGETLLSSSRAVGVAESNGHRVSWDLGFSPNQTTYRHISPRVAQLVKPVSHICSPNLDIRLSGVLRVDGREIILNEEPGCQSHLWGRKHVDEWVWAHSNAFEKHPDTVFEGLSARPRRGGVMLPQINSLMLRHRGEVHSFVRVRFADQWRRRLGMGYWSFTAMGARLRLEGVAQCRLRDMLQVTYVDPDGEPVYCINSEIGKMKIRIFRRVHAVRWRHVETISAFGTAHLEHASRRPDPNVRSEQQLLT
ncbi:MAG TPA: tocopherol cyclase family protein [Blastocatellia bacterium]|nr:tocopherol cyclase family protein [Blastocatellia bacterium]